MRSFLSRRSSRAEHRGGRSFACVKPRGKALATDGRKISRCVGPSRKPQLHRCRAVLVRHRTNARCSPLTPDRLALSHRWRLVGLSLPYSTAEVQIGAARRCRCGNGQYPFCNVRERGVHHARSHGAAPDAEGNIVRTRRPHGAVEVDRTLAMPEGWARPARAVDCKSPGDGVASPGASSECDGGPSARAKHIRSFRTAASARPRA